MPKIPAEEKEMIKSFYILPPIKLKSYVAKTYIRRCPGTLVYNCDPKVATEVKDIMVHPLYHWPIDFIGGIIYNPNYKQVSLRMYWRGWRGKRVCCLWTLVFAWGRK